MALGTLTTQVSVLDETEATVRRVIFENEVGSGTVIARGETELSDGNTIVNQVSQTELQAAAVAVGITGTQAMNFLKQVYRDCANKTPNLQP